MTTQQDRAELSLVHASCTKAFHEPDGERVELMAWLNAEADKWDYFGNKAVAKVLRKAAALLAASPAGQVPLTKVLMEHSGCGSGPQIDQLTVRLRPGDKVVLFMGKQSAAIGDAGLV